MSTTIGRAMEILMVEDSLFDARSAIDSLKDCEIRHRLTLVRDGEEALAFLRREGVFARAPVPDLVLLDLVLPKVSGWEVLEEMRADEALRDLPVVVMTSSSAYDVQTYGENLAVDSFIAKPLDREKFIRVIRQLRDRWHADLMIPCLE